MCRSVRLWLSALFLASQAAPAQTVIEDDERVASETPEAWAMRYMAGTTVMASFGETSRLARWRWNVAIDLGSIPEPPRVFRRLRGLSQAASADSLC